MNKFLSIATLLVAIGVSSCNQDVSKAKIKILESNTVSYCFFKDWTGELFVPGDTIWVDLKFHNQDDADSTTMKCVLLEKPHN